MSHAAQQRGPSGPLPGLTALSSRRCVVMATGAAVLAACSDDEETPQGPPTSSTPVARRRRSAAGPARGDRADPGRPRRGGSAAHRSSRGRRPAGLPRGHQAERRRDVAAHVGGPARRADRRSALPAAAGQAGMAQPPGRAGERRGPRRRRLPHRGVRRRADGAPLRPVGVQVPRRRGAGADPRPVAGRGCGPVAAHPCGRSHGRQRRADLPCRRTPAPPGRSSRRSTAAPGEPWTSSRLPRGSRRSA